MTQAGTFKWAGPLCPRYVLESGPRRSSYQMPGESRSGRFRQRCRPIHRVGEGGRVAHIYVGSRHTCASNKGTKLTRMISTQYSGCKIAQKDFCHHCSLPNRKKEDGLTLLGETSGEEQGDKLPHGCSLLWLSLCLSPDRGRAKDSQQPPLPLERLRQLESPVRFRWGESLPERAATNHPPPVVTTAT